MANPSEREFKIGEYWLSRRAGSENWQRTWFDPRSRQTRRASLGTPDFERAKETLADWYLSNRGPIQAEEADVTLAETLARYYEQHAKNLVSADRARSALQIWLDFYGEETVSALHDVRKQEAFHAYLRRRGLAPGSIKRILNVGRAAINRAWKRGEIKSAPFIQMVVVKDAPPKGRPLDVEEIVALLDAGAPHVRDFIFWMAATGARPDAILDLRWSQVDIEAGIVQLNPPGRAQTKKHRPTVRLPGNLLELVSKPIGPKDRVILYDGAPVSAIRNAWRGARKRAGLDEQVQPYSLRHTVARWLRMESVPAWEVAAQLGHSVSEFSMTERYAPYDPAYLKASTAALERLLTMLRSSCVAVEKTRVA